MNLKDRFSLCWRILRKKPGNLMVHAQRELPSLDEYELNQFSPVEQNEMQALMNRQLLELVLVFSTHGHSGLSAAHAVSMLEKLLRYEPIGPLTGEPEEWMEVGTGVFQNKRCGRVFKSAEHFGGQAYDIEAIVFREPNGACYTGSGSRQPIVFPYTPKTVYQDVPFESDGTCTNRS